MITVAFTKWGGGAHWTFTAERLGEDEHGVWCGAPAGLVMTRPGVRTELGYASVIVFPRAQPWTIAFNAQTPTSPCEVYIDMSTPPKWDETATRVTMVDLDLDVVRKWDGTIYVDDEDEFAQHQVELGYPAEIVELAERSCRDRQAALTANAEPFASVYRRWLELVS